ncbi:hypothetical protein INT47_011276 [Mucor saturninus]|uniref:Uncharacterized protein n=1 Tax=Mucor saturninus TaxID=64648 RepID=A0A8H7VBY0_9FUNG|nr:hypothetical protein INT47_011276 [Mucor saturninus]
MPPQIRHSNDLDDRYNSKTDLHNKIRTDYKTWTSSADYIRFWQSRADSIILLKTSLGSTELINETRSQTAASLPSELFSSSHDEDPSSSTDPTPTATPGSLNVSTTSCGPNKPISLTDLKLHGIHHHLTNIRKNFINKEQINNESCFFKDVKVSRISNKYQNAVGQIQYLMKMAIPDLIPLGFGEAKIQQDFWSKLLCLDTLRLAIFTKNAIGVHILDGALAFQIHGLNVTFYHNQVAAKGIYTCKKIAHIRFPQSLEDLSPFFTLINIQKLLMVNHIFWDTCKKSQHPDIIYSRYKEAQMSLDAIIDSSQDGTRQCVLRFGH